MIYEAECALGHGYWTRHKFDTIIKSMIYLPLMINVPPSAEFPPYYGVEAEDFGKWGTGAQQKWAIT